MTRIDKPRSASTTFCKDCDYFTTVSRAVSPESQYMCLSPRRRRDMVLGEMIPLSCIESRIDEFFCGPSARWFKPKEVRNEVPSPARRVVPLPKNP